MKGIYLASYKALHSDHNLIYQDINGKRDISGDMMNVDLTPYDYIIATPPCNWWARCNWRRDKSEYSLKTKHLLIDILKKLCKQDKPFIVENVRNDNQFKLHGLFDLPCHIYKIGQHTYWTNVLISMDIEQKHQNKQYISKNQRQGGYNVHQVIEQFIRTIE